MTRPLRYDDSFKSIIDEKIHEKFLYIFTVKVQSTAFCQKFNLQRSLLITSLWDIVIGIIILLELFYKIDEFSENYLFFLENMILLCGLVFGLVGIDASTNLRKANTKVYKNWRVFITLGFPVLELFNNLNFVCFYFKDCSKLGRIIFLVVYIGINFYFTKIAWSYFIRLERNHELLIIHGKYLEKMMNDESYKMNDIKKYVPPEKPMNTGEFTRMDSEEKEREMSVFDTSN